MKSKVFVKLDDIIPSYRRHILLLNGNKHLGSSMTLPEYKNIKSVKKVQDKQRKVISFRNLIFLPFYQNNKNGK
jgi:hypothetical protein